MKDYFYGVAGLLDEMVESGEVYLCFFEAEDSDFVRLNQARFRQAGSVAQRQMSIDLIAGRQHAAATLTLTGNLSDDRAPIGELLVLLRQQRAALPADPYLLYAREPQCTESIAQAAAPDAGTAVTEIMDMAAGVDLVGLWASGTLYRGFANSLGQRNWYAQPSFHFDWSCFNQNGRAVKGSYAGTHWEPPCLAQKLDAARAQLELLNREACHLKPGRYRTYLAPAAVQEIFGLVAWEGFGLKSHRTRQTPLIKLVRRQARLHPGVTVCEHHAGGVAPRFTASGYTKPARVTLVRDGLYDQCLVSPRSGMEYGEPVNAGSEFPESLELSAGELAKDAVLEQLDTGLYVSHLWYCNFSDRNDCRITGMTRYACFWVQDAAIIAPFSTMRFDDSLYHLFGDKLLGLTTERERLFSADTYYQRSTQSALVPGALIEEFNLTL
ncbi:MAG: metallopeptidase TldD-related protein [Gammaproteobacteria bacterium]